MQVQPRGILALENMSALGGVDRQLPVLHEPILRQTNEIDDDLGGSGVVDESRSHRRHQRRSIVAPMDISRGGRACCHQRPGGSYLVLNSDKETEIRNLMFGRINLPLQEVLNRTDRRRHVC